MNIKGLSVRGVEIGSGIPKICVPIIGKTHEEILRQAGEIVKEKPDCIELRIDWYEHVFVEEKVLDLLKSLREVIGNHVLLFTFRTALEGGEKEISVDAYTRLCEAACKSGCIDLLDVEAFMENGLLERMLPVAHENHVYIVGSNHNFKETPSEEELYRLLIRIDEMGADIPKVAVMPVRERDVLNLLSATLLYHERGGTKPIITMSMKGMGAISRLAGGLVGSVLTFVTVGQASAPGQLPMKQIREILKTF